MFEVDVDIPKDLNLARYRPSIPVSDQMWATVPEVVGSAISSIIGPDIPINANIPYTYLQAGLLPHFVVAFFMAFQKPRANISYTTVFARSMHLIEEYREFMLDQSGAFDRDETALGPQPGPSSQPYPDEGSKEPGKGSEESGRGEASEGATPGSEGAGPTAGSDEPETAAGSEAPEVSDEAEEEAEKKEKKKKKKNWSYASWEERNKCNQQ